jgi:hypothetical protein
MPDTICTVRVLARKVGCFGLVQCHASLEGAGQQLLHSSFKVLQTHACRHSKQHGQDDIADACAARASLTICNASTWITQHTAAAAAAAAAAEAGAAAAHIHKMCGRVRHQKQAWQLHLSPHLSQHVDTCTPVHMWTPIHLNTCGHLYTCKPVHLYTCTDRACTCTHVDTRPPSRHTIPTRGPINAEQSTAPATPALSTLSNHHRSPHCSTTQGSELEHPAGVPQLLPSAADTN